MQIWVDADACPDEIKELLFRDADTDLGNAGCQSAHAHASFRSHRQLTRPCGHERDRSTHRGTG